jgi:hypothetical protein
VGKNGVVPVALAFGMTLSLFACSAPSRGSANGSAPASSPAKAAATATPTPRLASIEADAGAPSVQIPIAPRVGTILIIGDSHAFGPFGRTLHELLARTSEHVVFEAACGATTEMFLFPYPEVVCGYRVLESKGIEASPHAVVSTWHNARIHNLDTMMKTYQPEVVVVVLGTNYPRAPVADSTEAFMKRLCRAPSIGRACPRVFWVGPPAFGAQAGVYISKTIRSVVEGHDGAMFIDSTVFNEQKPLPLRKPHFGDDEGRRWAEFAFTQIASELVQNGP